MQSSDRSAQRRAELRQDAGQHDTGRATARPALGDPILLEVFLRLFGIGAEQAPEVAEHRLLALGGRVRAPAARRRPLDKPDEAMQLPRTRTRIAAAEDDADRITVADRFPGEPTIAPEGALVQRDALDDRAHRVTLRQALTQDRHR